MCGINDVKESEIQTAEPLVPEPNAFEVEREIEKLKRHKSPGIDKIQQNVTVCRAIRSQIHKLINSVRHRDKLPQQWKY